MSERNISSRTISCDSTVTPTAFAHAMDGYANNKHHQQSGVENQPSSGVGVGGIIGIVFGLGVSLIIAISCGICVCRGLGRSTPEESDRGRSERERVEVAEGQRYFSPDTAARYEGVTVRTTSSLSPVDVRLWRESVD